jgi:hypothetical protein
MLSLKLISAYVSIRQYTSVYVSLRQATCVFIFDKSRGKGDIETRDTGRLFLLPLLAGAGV